MFSLNVGLERQKAKLTLQVTRTELSPGDTLCGVLNVAVQQDMKITAVRLEVRAKERCDFKVKGANRVVDEFVHFQQDITFFGFSKQSGRKGGAELSVGTYQYPFQVPIPSTAPPSYYFKGSMGAAYLDWKVKATIVIPNSPFDAKEESLLTVYSAVTKKQYDQLCSEPYVAGHGSGAIPPSSSCCGGNGGELTVDVTTFPRAVLMHRSRTSTATQAGDVALAPSQCYPGEYPPDKKQPDLIFEEPPSCRPDTNATEKPPAVPNVLAVPPNSGFSDDDNALSVRLALKAAHEKIKLNKVRVILNQFVQVSGGSHAFCDIQKISSLDIVPSSGILKSGSTLVLDAHLLLGDLMRMDKQTVATAPLPTMATKMIETSFIVTISFPDSSVKDEITINNAAYLFSVLDMSNRVALAPTRYVAADVRTEQILSGM